MFQARRRHLAASGTAAIAALAAGAVWWSVSARQPQGPSQRNITVTTEAANLAATVSTPAGRGPFPGVVFVHGSGRLKRDVFQRDRDHLVSRGFVVLTYDKRGVGESTGEYDNVGVRTSPERMPLLGRDALACLRALRAQPRVDGSRLGFLGASQAGWIIPSAIASAGNGEVRFAVILSGPATSVGLEHAYSEATGDGLRPHASLTPEQIDARVDAYAGPAGFDHVAIIRALRVPTLWLIGEQDESIPVRHTLRNLRGATAAGATITVKTYPGANHSLFSPAGPVPYWTDIVNWLRAERILD